MVKPGLESKLTSPVKSHWNILLPHLTNLKRHILVQGSPEKGSHSPGRPETTVVVHGPDTSAHWILRLTLVHFLKYMFPGPICLEGLMPGGLGRRIIRTSPQVIPKAFPFLLGPPGA